jgi:NAD(P)-dependent dehydrogenase (short-subunit alcohol dehydrogenase family)
VTVTWTRDAMGDLRGRSFLVTGANSGIGRGAAKALVEHGAEVTLACRDPDKGRAARDEMQALGKGAVHLEALDLADLASVRAFAARWTRPLDVLVNNAGLMAVPEAKTKDGFELQLGTNHLGHFALTGLLFERLSEGRVVTVTSLQGFFAQSIDFDDLSWARRGYQRWPAYQASKLANLLFTAELARRVRARGLHTIAVACHPGTADTALHGGPASGGVIDRGLAWMGHAFGQPAAWGAEPTLYAATSPKVRPDDLIGPALGVWGHPVRHPRPPWTTNPEAARRLWEVSEQLTGVRFLD